MELLVGTLTFREREILGLLAHGLTIRHIAQRLCLSYQTVRSHIYNLFVKLGVHSQVEAVRFALEHRVVEAPGILARQRVPSVYSIRRCSPRPSTTEGPLAC